MSEENGELTELDRALIDLRLLAPRLDKVIQPELIRLQSQLTVLQEELADKPSDAEIGGLIVAAKEPLESRIKTLEGEKERMVSTLQKIMYKAYPSVSASIAEECLNELEKGDND